MPEKKKVKPAKKANKPAKSKPDAALIKQIVEVRNSAISIYNVLEKKGIMNEKEFMDEYNLVSSKKK